MAVSPSISVVMISRLLAGAERCLLFRVALAGPSLGFDRQIERPGRLSDHEMGELIRATEAFRHLVNDLVVNVQDYGITGGFDPQHRLCKQITCDPADDVFSPQAAISALAVAAITE